MNDQEAKEALLEAWGIFGASWGINKTMAQIQMLLLLSPEPLSTVDIMEQLKISRGNANMNIRALIDWGVVFKKIIPGERKEYFTTEKDIWKLARIVAAERKKREIQPVIDLMNDIQASSKKNGQLKDPEVIRVTNDVKEFMQKANTFIETFSAAEKNTFLKFLMKL